MWSQPEERERVDVAALLRSLPVLLEGDTGLPDGAAETIVVSGERRARLIFGIEGGRLYLNDEANNNAVSVACIEGDESAWIAALGPARDYSALRFTRGKRLGKRILGALAAGA